MRAFALGMLVDTSSAELRVPSPPTTAAEEDRPRRPCSNPRITSAFLDELPKSAEVDRVQAHFVAGWVVRFAVSWRFLLGRQGDHSSRGRTTYASSSRVAGDARRSA